MAARLVIDRLSEGAVQPTPDGHRDVEPPTVIGIRIVFGVGASTDDEPTADTFKPVYTVQIPVFSLGGLDADGVYEFDARAMLGLLQSRALRRHWAARLELEVAQSPDGVAAADLYVEAPAAAPDLEILGRTQRGVTTAGGGRVLVLASGLVHRGDELARLDGTYAMRLSDADPAHEGAASVSSRPRKVTLACTQFEFEG